MIATHEIDGLDQEMPKTHRVNRNVESKGNPSDQTNEKLISSQWAMLKPAKGRSKSMLVFYFFYAVVIAQVNRPIILPIILSAFFEWTRIGFNPLVARLVDVNMVKSQTHDIIRRALFVCVKPFAIVPSSHSSFSASPFP